MRYLRYTLIILLAFTISLGVEAKKVKLSKNIVYEGTVLNGAPNGQGRLTIHSCLDKNLTLLTLDGVFYNTEVKNASLMINGGMKITAPSIYLYKMAAPSKKTDGIDFQINSKWSIENTKSVKVENATPAYIRCRCDMKTDKKWHFVAFDETEQLSILNNGVILSNFINYDTPLSAIGEDVSNIKKQDVCYRLFVVPSRNADEALGIELLSAQKTYLSNGVEIEHRDNSFYCKYPNANFVVLNKDGSINNYKIALEGGRIESFPSNTTITYDDGKVFTSSDNNPIQTSKNIASCKNVSEITTLNGDMTYPDGIVDIYSGGKIIGHKYPLKDSGVYISRNDEKNGLNYPDGSKFVATTENGLLSKKKYSSENNTTDYTLVTGVFTNSVGHETKYKNGEVETKDLTDLRQMAVGKGIVELSIPSWQGRGLGCNPDDDFFCMPFLSGEEPRQIDKKHYYIEVKDNLCLSIPKSFVMKSGNEVTEIRTLDYETYSEGYGSLGGDYMLVWVYEPTVKMKNIQYGITKGIWVVNKESEEIAYDLREILKSGNNNRYNYVWKNVVNKRKYHARGKIESCYMCGGDGDMSDWRAGHYIRCTTCGGKGWVVEHYW